MAMKADHFTERSSIERFDQIVNVGPAMSDDFERLGLEGPKDLIGKNAMDLYEQICEVDQTFHDPCVLDVYMATIDYMNGNPPQAWWKFTGHRKKKYEKEVNLLRQRSWIN
ncbi:MAG: helix-hairpin-helix domain-containing protein [Planctomycetota bacterium]